ncbi:PAQR family membrane homeostasis protein TrhA [Actinocatenispora comari]|uniref:Membrane protein n=1 Tax=Actinocatenispora comari TaxID=2807577 RepID=A0A8J4ADS6_9ACTN|nr:hemolysin III family protein [Actinocatenispora comari]GIL29741.1 membrane protein [Actinocatenispora comari]
MTATTLGAPAGKDPYARPRMRGRLHAYAVGVAAVCGVVLCSVAASRPGWLAFASCLVYSVTTCGLFGISALYHRHVWGPRGYAVMKRLDHSMIFLFIAGTYTPFSLLLMPRRTALIVLSVVWGGALLGVALKMAWPRAPRWLSVPLYIALGWVAAFVFPDIVHGGGWAPFALLLAGGVVYSLGALCYALKRPNPWPRTFGHHEFFHAATLIAAACHHVAVYFAVLA